MEPILVLGQRAGAKLLRADKGFTDDGTAIVVLAETEPVAPAGVTRDCLFDSVYLTVTWTMGVTLRLTPILDGELMSEEAVDLNLEEQFAGDTEGKRRFQPFVMRLNQDAFEGERLVGREGMRGTWFALRIASVGGIARGTLIVDGVSLEYDDELTETREAVA